MSSSNITTKLDIQLRSIIPEDESVLLNQMLSEFRSQYRSTLGKEPDFLTPSNIVYVLMTAFSARIYDLYYTLSNTVKGLLLPTSINQNLDMWASLKGVSMLPANQAEGYVTFATLAPSILLPQDSVLESVAGEEYTVIQDYTSATHTYSVIDVVQTDTNVTYTLNIGSDESHGMFTGQSVTLSGSVNSGYNGVKTITVISSNKIEFQIPFVELPDTDLSNLRVSYTGIRAKVKSVNYSENANAGSGVPLSLSSVIDGLSDVGYITFNGITGGGSSESDDNFKRRILLKFERPYTRMNRNDVYDLLSQLDSRVSGYAVRQGYPVAGEATIYVSKSAYSSSDAGFTTGELNAFASYLESMSDIGIQGVTVNNFTPVNINVDIDNLSPNSLTMQEAVKVAIYSYFQELEYGTDVKVDELRSIISTAISTVNEPVSSFDLVAPTSNTSVGAYSKAYLGTLNISTV